MSQSVEEVRNLQERLSALRLNKASKAEYEVSLYIGNSKQLYPYKGTLDATDFSVGMQTGAIRLRSVFENPNTILLPGMFVWASVEELGRTKAIVIPQKSVIIGAEGKKSVWLIDADNKASKHPIEIGTAYGNNWIVLNGLETGDRLIVEGTMMLRPGATVKPQQMEAELSDISPDIAPDSSENASSSATNEHTPSDKAAQKEPQQNMSEDR